MTNFPPQSDTALLREVFESSGLSESDFATKVLIRPLTTFREWMDGSKVDPVVIDWLKTCRKFDIERQVSSVRRSRYKIPFPGTVDAPNSEDQSQWSSRQRVFYESIMQAGFALHLAEAAMKATYSITDLTNESSPGDIHDAHLMGSHTPENTFGSIGAMAIAAVAIAIEVWRDNGFPPLSCFKDSNFDIMHKKFREFRNAVFHGASLYDPIFIEVLNEKSVVENLRWSRKLLSEMRLNFAAVGKYWAWSGAISLSVAYTEQL